MDNFRNFCKLVEERKQISTTFNQKLMESRYGHDLEILINSGRIYDARKLYLALKKKELTYQKISKLRLKKKTTKECALLAELESKWQMLNNLV